MIGEILGGLTSLGGLSSSNAAASRANREREAALAELKRLAEQGYADSLQEGRTGLLSETGLLGDALRSLGGNLGSAMAAGGVYNSSATAGALANAQREMQTQLAQTALRNIMAARQQRQSGLSQAANARLGVAGDKYNVAQAGQQQAQGGLMSFLGSLGQYNLARAGQNQVQNGLGRSAGGYGNPSPLSVGAGLTKLSQMSPMGQAEGVTDWMNQAKQSGKFKNFKF